MGKKYEISKLGANTGSPTEGGLACVHTGEERREAAASVASSR